MTIIEEITKHGTATFSWSSYKDVIHCPMKAVYRLALGRQLNETSNWDLEFGKLLHKAIELRSKHGEQKAFDYIEEFFEDETNSLTAENDEYGRNQTRAEDIFTQYCELYPRQQEPISLGAEQEVIMPLGEVGLPGQDGLLDIKIQWKGILDDVWQHNRKRIIKDTKTSKQAMSASRREGYAISGQMMMYCWLVNESLGHGPYRCNDAIIDFITIKKPLTRKSKNSNDAREEFERSNYHFSDDQIDNFKNGVLLTLQHWLKMIYANPLEHTPKVADSYSCKLPYPCPYFDACCAPTWDDTYREVTTNPKFSAR